jgi:crotonobetainyl-CoA:carnitine CoA-transferase CaiB-like acyl-CoA transferase
MGSSWNQYILAGALIMESILTGLRVIDAATYIAAPSAAAILADFGADVIKIERPPHGDPFRYLHLSAGMPASDVPYPFLVDNRSKRSLALDLSRKEGREVLLKLAAGADIFLTNYQPALIRKFGLDWEQLRLINPRLIYASVTGYGESGPDAAKPGYDMTAYYARTGLMDFIHNAGAEPALSPCGFGDHPTAVTLFAGILLALYRRDRTGEGSKVATTLMANGVWANSSLMQGALCGASFREKRTRSNPHNPLVNHYTTADGKRFLFCLLDPVQDWPKLCAAIAREDLKNDPRFDSPQTRRDNSAELVRMLDAIFAVRTMAELGEAFAAQDILFSPVASIEEVAADPAMIEQGLFVDFAGEDLRTVAHPIRVEGVDIRPAQRIPLPGEHTHEILRELGYSLDQIQALCYDGIALQAELASKDAH